MSQDIEDLEPNDLLVLISGVSGGGKSASLMNLRNPEKWMYLNCEAGKRLPFKSKVQQYKITDPYQVYDAFDHATENADDYEGIIIDTATFLMEMFESQYVLTADNTMQAWGDYQQFLKNLMQVKVPLFNKPVIILAHVRDDIDDNGIKTTSVPVKGALKNNGIEAFFSTVVTVQKETLKSLEGYKNDYLHIEEEEKELGFKHVFQTKVTNKTTGTRIRSPLKLFSKDQTFIDNDAQQLLDILAEYYDIPIKK